MGVHERVHWWETGGRLVAWFDVWANGVYPPVKRFAGHLTWKSLSFFLSLMLVTFKFFFFPLLHPIHPIMQEFGENQ